MSRLLTFAATVACALIAPAAAGAAVSPPEPTGPAPVGFTRVTLTDHHRSEVIAEEGGLRRIPLRVWYPAARDGGRPGDVLTPLEQAGYEAGFGLPSGAFDGLGDTSRAGAAPAPGRHAVI